MKIKEKKIKHAWSILCSGFSIDRSSNNATLFNVIEQINVPRSNLIKVSSSDKDEVAIPIDISLVSSWHKIGTISVSADIRVEISDPVGNKRELENYHVDMPDDVHRVRLLASWQGIRASVSGKYVFSLFVREMDSDDFVKDGEVSVDVHILDEDKK